MSKQKDLIESLRAYIGVRFSHQGRTRKTGMDCGGLILVGGRTCGLTSLEFLGYANFPTGGKFDELLEAELNPLGIERRFPFRFNGDEFEPADIVSFDYGNGEGTRHIAMITEWDGRRYRIIDAHQTAGVSEHPLAPPFVRTGTSIKGWRVKDFC